MKHLRRIRPIRVVCSTVESAEESDLFSGEFVAGAIVVATSKEEVETLKMDMLLRGIERMLCIKLALIVHM